MAPREETPLIQMRAPMVSQWSMEEEGTSASGPGRRRFFHSHKATFALAMLLSVLFAAILVHHNDKGRILPSFRPVQRTGPYRLVERQVGSSFLSYYDFHDGPDTLGSAGYNNYVSRRRALELGLVQVEPDTDMIVIQSASTNEGPRESIRLEGKRRFNRGLFLLDVDHIPAGCGVWPAFWLTDDDEGQWPKHGEIDIVEGVNTLSTAKTALHTSESCSMYAHVPSWSHTGVWDRATGLPDTWTGEMDFNTSVPADNCWNLAAHQWENQGCVMAETRPDTIGAGLNRDGGGVYALEWDPTNGYIKSWVWKRDELPANLKDAMATSGKEVGRIDPDPSTWNIPYAYFAIGKDSGCSADHFQNHRIIFNLAFCGTVAGNRFLMDCPSLSNWTVKNDPVKACNAYIQSRPAELDEAFWRIRGVYVYERSMERVLNYTRSSKN